MYNIINKKSKIFCQFKRILGATDDSDTSLSGPLTRCSLRSTSMSFSKQLYRTKKMYKRNTVHEFILLHNPKYPTAHTFELCGHHLLQPSRQ